MTAPDIERVNQPERESAPQRSLETPAAAVQNGAAQLLHLQRAAGNRAVAGLLAVQRAPNDDPRRTSGMAHGPTLNSSGGVATAPTLPGNAGSSSSPAAGDASANAGAPGADPGALGAAGKPLSGPPTIQSQEDEGDFPEPPAPRRGKHPEGIKPAAAATLAEAQEAYRRDPNFVYRSKNDSLHRQYWKIDPATGGGAPRIYKSGKVYIIAPEIVGPGLPPPHAEPIEADEGAEIANVRAMSEHLDARLRTKSSIPLAAPAPGTPPPRHTPGMAYGPTLDNSGGLATAPTVPGPSADPRPSSGMAPGPAQPAQADPTAATAPTPAVAATEPASGSVSEGGLKGPPTAAGVAEEGDFDEAPAAGEPTPRSRFATTPEYGGRAPVVGKVAHVINSQEEAEALYVRLNNERQFSHLGTSDADLELEAWHQDAGPTAKGEVPVAWIRDDGVVRFNLTRFQRPNLGGYTTEPFAPIPFVRMPWEPPGPSSIPAGMRPPDRAAPPGAQTLPGVGAAGPGSTPGSPQPAQADPTGATAPVPIPSMTLPGTAIPRRVPAIPTAAPTEPYTAATRPTVPAAAAAPTGGSSASHGEVYDDPVAASQLLADHSLLGGPKRLLGRGEGERVWRTEYGGQGRRPAAWFEASGNKLVVDADLLPMPVRSADILQGPIQQGAAPAPTEPGPATRPTVPAAAVAPTEPHTAATPASAPDGESVTEDSTPTVTSPGGSRVTQSKERKVSASPLGLLKAKPSIASYSSEQRTDTVVGQTDEGTDINTTKASKSQINLGPKGVDASKEVSHTTAGGTKVAAGGNVSFDSSGNMSAVGSLTFESQRGLSISPTVGHSDEADASDPQYVEGVGFVVTFKISSTDSVGVGGGKSAGGTHASVNVGKSKAEYQSGSRIFKTLEEATDFRDNSRRAERSVFMPPPTSVIGALQIPTGESRGGGTSTATTVGGSLSYGEGMGDVGITHASTSTEEVSVMRTGPTTVDVTRTFSEDTATDPHISGLGISNTKGQGEETGHAVTYQFDLSTESGQAAFTRWCQAPEPPGSGATNKRVKDFSSSNAHDEYSFPVKFSAKWKNHKFESREVDEAGNVTEKFVGGQDRDTRTGWVARNITRDKEQHANAQIEATLKNGQESYAARFTASGKSGDSNLEELGKMFSGARHDADDSSRYWLVTARINPAIVHELERDNPAFRNAKTTADKMRIYREYEENGGAQMIAGQVSSGGDPLAWNLELPGDPNFPGASGREELEDKGKAQREQLAEKHDSAASVADDAKQTITKLEARKAAVADRKKYTDLPDQLREEQVNLVDSHIAKFAAVRSQSESLAMRNDPNDDIKTIRTRAASPHGYDKLPPDQLELKKLSDDVAIKEADIATASMRVKAANVVLDRMMPGNVVRYGEGVKGSVYFKFDAEAKEHRGTARTMDEKLQASAKKARELRNQWSDAKDDSSQLAALRALDAELKEQLIWVEMELEDIREATRAAYVVTSDYGIGRDWDYYTAIKCDGNLRALAINTASGQVSEDEL